MTFMKQLFYFFPFCLLFLFFCFLSFSVTLSRSFSLHPSCLLPMFLSSSIKHISTTMLMHNEHFLLRSFCSTNKLLKSVFSFTVSCICSSVRSLLFFLRPFVFSALGDKEGGFSCFQKVGERTEFLWRTLWWTWWVSEKANVAVVSGSGLKNAEAAVFGFSAANITSSHLSDPLIWEEVWRTIKCLNEL